ncbi:hypothetical protein SAMN02745126_06347 [Enhydrobacter aerosaccus]|uniref:Uncharacterized protein n=1 Tax=Enhydrobacter aerosaccus TaxID=225324 RepID=A0A1T4TJJ9_9HYPH|nr:hypothetical protein [Enhydrobacter aerosaccus]SKA40409.1 hypothetical protein SAMN02745126_06347 [Enhydrobacter aerosaccus]
MRRSVIIAGTLCLALIASGCATGVSRPLGKCSSTADRRPLNPQRWPGGLKQVQGLVAEGEVRQAPAPVASPARPAARPASRAVILEPVPPPRSLEINPTTPTSDQRAEKPAGAQIVEVACNG